MPDIADQVIADVRANIVRDGSEVTFTDAGGEEITVTARIYRADREVDPDTESGVFEPFASVTAAISDIGSIPTDEWTVAFTDPTGESVSGRVVNVRTNRTFGIVTVYVEAEE